MKFRICLTARVHVICVGRTDDRPLSDVITLTSALPFAAAGCTTLHSTIDKAHDSSSCSATRDLMSAASNTLLANRAVHTASLKHVLVNLSQLVSSCLCHVSFSVMSYSTMRLTRLP